MKEERWPDSNDIFLHAMLDHSEIDSLPKSVAFLLRV